MFCECRRIDNGGFGGRMEISDGDMRRFLRRFIN